MSAYVTQTDLENQFGAARVAQVFSVVNPDGTSTGTADATTIAYAIRMGCAEVDRILLGVLGDSMPFNPDPTQIPDTLKQIAGIIVMHAGVLRLPEAMGGAGGDPKKSPYFVDYERARADLKEVRKSEQRLDGSAQPANVGGDIENALPTTQQPWFFIPDPSSGCGGFGSGGY